MAAPYYTTNPLDFTKLEGVIISETSPVPSIIREGANAGVLIAAFERGPKNDPKRVSSISEVHQTYGNNQLYGGNKALRLKGWANLYVTRVVASDAAKAAFTQTVSSKDLATFTALSEGVWGNSVKINVADGTSANTKKFTITEEGTEKVEVYDNLELAGKTDQELNEIFKRSDLVVVTGAHATDETENGDLSLAGGSDGNLAATDYQAAIQAANVNVRGKIYFTDDQSLPVKTALANFIKTERDGICVLGPVNKDATVDEAIAEADSLQDQEGRVIYCYNHIKFNVLGVIETESPVFLTASILNLIPPNISIADASNRNLTQTAVGVDKNLSRADFIKLKEAGIAGYEDDQHLGVRIRSAVTKNPEWTIIRRRMSDFLLSSLGRFLKNFQNKPNNFNNRAAIKAAIRGFDDRLIADKILPSDLDSGTQVLQLLVEGTTTPEEQAQGIQKITYKRRIFAEMKFIVLQASIGESVVVEEVS